LKTPGLKWRKKRNQKGLAKGAKWLSWSHGKKFWSTQITLGNHSVLDLRTTAEVDRDGYIEGGFNIPMHELLVNLDKLPTKDAPIVAYCGIGHRGALALPVLQMLGYENVTSLYLGMRGWKTASMPVAGWVNWQSLYTEYFAGMPANFYVIRPDPLNTALAENPPFLVDLREASEIEQNGYIAGAVHIPVRELLKNLDKLPAQDQPIALICASGHRGGIALPALQLLGYTNVTNLVGGVGAWKKADFPVETGMPAAAESISSPVVDATRLRDLDAYISAIPANLYAVKPGDLNLEIGEGTVPFIIDNRTEAEWNNGYIEGSVHIPINELFARLSEMPSDKSTPIVVVCQSGHRGGIALIALMMIGYTDVRNLGGGVNAWVGAEFPVIQ
jgi:rhodanese-related sulfurtransferase